MNLLSKKTMSLLFVASMLFANGLAMERNRTPEEQLYEACRDGNLKEVKELLKHPNIDVNADIYSTRTSVGGLTSLHIACCYGHTEVVKILLKHPKIDVNKGNEGGWTPLFMACSKGHTGVIKKFLKLKSPKIDLKKGKDIFGGNQLNVACKKDYLDIVRVLLAFGADFRIRNEDGETPLDIVRRYDSSRKLVKTIKNPLAVAVFNLGSRGVEVYIRMDLFDFHKKYKYKVIIDGKEKTWYCTMIQCAELMLQKLEDDLSKIFLTKEKKVELEKKEIELKEKVVKIEKIIELLKTLLPQYKELLKRARREDKFCDCVVLTFL